MRREQGRFREELGLSPAVIRGFTGEDATGFPALAREAGFNRAAVVDPGRLEQWAVPGSRTAGTLEWEWVRLPRSWPGSSTVLVCCLSCLRPEPDDLSAPGDPHALVAPFARAHYYKEAIRMLRRFAVLLEQATGIPRASLRLFSNSRIPEKPLLAASGLGRYGRNGLAIVPGLGSLFVIAGAVIPVPTPRGLTATVPAVPVDPCGACRRCIDACPTGAIVTPGVVDPSRCLQGAAASAAALPPGVMERWGARLYGCQACQDSCPHNVRLTENAARACGEVGPSLPLRRLLSDGPGALKGLFAGTAMGMSWVAGEALLRNALVAAGHRGERSLAPAVAAFGDSASPGLRAAARWSLERLG
jgi:epoxyqueuosine reductase